MDGRYLINNRLGDVITLIQILALNPEFSYRTSEKLAESIGKPNSKEKWVEIAKEHSEFFRVSQDDKIILLTRFAMDPEGKKPSALKLEETKILIDNAIDLYGKELTRQSNDLQLKSIRTVFGAALLSIIISAISAFYTFSNQNNDEKIMLNLSKIQQQIDTINSRLYTIPSQKGRSKLDSTIQK